MNDNVRMLKSVAGRKKEWAMFFAFSNTHKLPPKLLLLGEMEKESRLMLFAGFRK